MKDQPFALIGVNSDDVERANAAVEANKLNWRSFQNEPAGSKSPSISKAWMVRGWPTIVVLDADMKVRYRGHDGHAATRIAKELVAKLTSSRKGD